MDPRPDGRPAPGGPLVEALEDKLEVIAAGQAVAILPAGHDSSLRPDLTTVPLAGVEPSQVVLATRAGDCRRLLSAFRACDHLARQARLAGPRDRAYVPARRSPDAGRLHDRGMPETPGDGELDPTSFQRPPARTSPFW